jgi:hypothetical protein
VYGWLQFDYLSSYYEGTLGICAGFLVFYVGKSLGFIWELDTTADTNEGEEDGARAAKTLP